MKSKVERRKEIIKIRSGNQQKKISESKVGSLKKYSKVNDSSQAKKKQKTTQYKLLISEMKAGTSLQILWTFKG